MPKRICSVKDCDRPHYGRGFCSLHWDRWSRHGDPLVRRGAANGELMAWLRDAVQTRDRSTGCWEWPFARRALGHGYIEYEGHNYTAHAVALILSGSPRPGRLHALHSCDNPPCCNPAHLRWGTDADNRSDSVQRHRTPRGENHSCTTLTAEDVLAIRADQRLHRVIAAEYGITKSSVGDLKHRRSWKHLP